MTTKRSRAGERLRAARKKAGLSQEAEPVEEVAKKLGAALMDTAAEDESARCGVRRRWE